VCTEEESSIDSMINAFRARHKATLTQLMEVEEDAVTESRSVRMDTAIRKPVCCCTGTMLVRMSGADIQGL
jgi:hypothetical protein